MHAEHFQVLALAPYAPRERWDSFESRVARNVDRLIELLAEATGVDVANRRVILSDGGASDGSTLAGESSSDESIVMLDVWRSGSSGCVVE
jgi:hypothetical protein